MLSWCTQWIRRRFYKRRREALHAAFHNNGNNLYLKVLSGLELLTLPNNHGSNDYPELPVIGKLVAATPTFSLLVERLEFAFLDHALMLTGCEPKPFPEHLKKEKHPAINRWVDLYFNTTDADVLREKLRHVLELLQQHEEAYVNKTQPENSVLWNRTQHILRELDTIVEHYL